MLISEDTYVRAQVNNTPWARASWHARTGTASTVCHHVELQLQDQAAQIYALRDTIRERVQDQIEEDQLKENEDGD